jgi:hypothetical protein
MRVLSFARIIPEGTRASRKPALIHPPTYAVPGRIGPYLRALRVATLLQEIYVGPLSREGEPTVLRKVKEVFTATIVRVRAFVDCVRNSVAYFRYYPSSETYWM